MLNSLLNYVILGSATTDSVAAANTTFVGFGDSKVVAVARVSSSTLKMEAKRSSETSVYNKPQGPIAIVFFPQLATSGASSCTAL
jgi:hypothetical protein